MRCFSYLQLDNAVIVSAITLGLLTLLIIRTLSYRFEPGNSMFRLAHAALLTWIGATTMQLASTSLGCKSFWFAMTLPGITVTCVAWSFFLFDFGSLRNRKIVLPRKSILWGSGVISFLAAVSNSWHHLIIGPHSYVIGRAEFGTMNGTLVPSKGDLYYLLLIHNYMWVIVSLLLAIRGYRTAKPDFQALIGSLLLMTAVPVSANIGYQLFNINIFGVDPTPYTVLLTFSSYAWIIVNSRLLNPDKVGERNIFEHSDAPIFVVGRDGRILSWNPAAQTLLGRWSDSGEGQAEKVIADFGVNLATGGYGTDMPKLTIGHNAFQPQAVVVEDPIHVDRPSLGWTVTLFDVTRQEEVAVSLRIARDRAEETSRLQADLLSVASHELRTPLTSIRGALDLVQSGKFGELPEGALRIMSIARRNSIRLGALVNDLLDLQKLEAGRFELTMTPVCVCDIVQDAFEELESFAAASDITLQFAKVAGDCMAVTDEKRLGQVILNVGSNAIKFSEPGGVVKVTVIQSEDAVEVQVRDEGKGIPEGAEDKVFGRFSQLDSSSTRSHEGTGLGMNISKLLMEKMGGTIGYSSKLGEGTVFHVRIPARPADDPEASPDVNQLEEAMRPEVG